MGLFGYVGTLFRTDTRRVDRVNGPEERKEMTWDESRPGQSAITCLQNLGGTFWGGSRDEDMSRPKIRNSQLHQHRRITTRQDADRGCSTFRRAAAAAGAGGGDVFDTGSREVNLVACRVGWRSSIIFFVQLTRHPLHHDMNHCRSFERAATGRSGTICRPRHRTRYRPQTTATRRRRKERGWRITRSWRVTGPEYASLFETMAARAVVL